MREDQLKELQRIQEVAIDNAIAEFDEACGLSLQEQQERGDRRWLTQMASSSLKLSADIARLLKPVSNNDEEREEAELSAIINAATTKVLAFDRKKG
jgi:hypothetical protein